MTSNSPVVNGGRDAQLLSHIRDAVSRSLARVSAQITRVESMDPIDVPELDRALKSLDAARDSLIKMETKIATDRRQQDHTHSSGPVMDLGEARDQISRQLDKLRRAMGPTEVSGGPE